MISHATKNECFEVTISAVCERTVYFISALCMCGGRETEL